MFRRRENTLAKLTIEGFQDEALTQPVNTIRVAYNPDNISLEYGFVYVPTATLNGTANAPLDYEKVTPQNISFDLILEEQSPHGTGSVQKQLTDLRQLCGVRDATTREPRYLRVSWGAMGWNGDGVFIGRMSSLRIQHTLFDRDGTPMRATAALTLLEDRKALQSHRNLLVSPAHHIKPVVRVSDKSSLAMIAQRAVMTGLGVLADRAPATVVDLAAANDLDHFADFIPGDTLVWPTQSGRAS